MNLHQARDYRFNQQGELTNVLTHFPSIIRAGAGMSANANEIARWIIALQNGKFFEKSSSLDTLWQAATLSNDTWSKENPSKHPYALGWYVVERLQNLKIISAGGGQSVLVVYPQDDLSIVLLTNLAGVQPENFIDEIAEFYRADFGLSGKVKVLKKELEQHGYDNAQSITNKLQKEQQFSFNSAELNHFANLLVKHQNKAQANAIFGLNNDLFSKVKLQAKTLNQYLGRYNLVNFKY